MNDGWNILSSISEETALKIKYVEGKKSNKLNMRNWMHKLKKRNGDKKEKSVTNYFKKF